MKGLTAPQQIADPDGKPAKPGRAHILVVDDDPESRERLAMYLRDAGYSVSCAEDAITAGHRMVDERLPDLVIADFKMPYMDGVQFVAALRADATIPDLPVVFVTSSENRPQIAGRTFGFPLLTKPLTSGELLATVATQLHAREV